MGSIGASEVLIILVVALLVLGPERLPDAARQAGRAIAELRRMSAGLQAEIRDALDSPVPGTQDPREVGSARHDWDDLPPAAGPGDPPGDGTTGP